MKQTEFLRHLKLGAYIALAFGLHLTSTIGKAEAGGLPEEMHGEWYLPSCAQPQMMVINTEHFSLQVEKSGRTIFMLVNDVNEYDDYYRAMINWSYSVFHVDPRGELQQNITPRSKTDSLPDSWAELGNDFNITYVRCEDNDLLQSVKPELADLMPIFKKLDILHENCPYIGREANLACHKTAFDITDSNQNGTLEYEELTGIYKAIDYFHTNMAAEDMNSLASQNEKAHRFISDIAGLAGQDTPEDIALTYEMVQEQWPALATIQSGQEFLIKVETLHQRIAGDMNKVSDCSTESSLAGSAIPQSTVNAENQSCFTGGGSYILEQEEPASENDIQDD